jgi:hypothetical protein
MTIAGCCCWQCVGKRNTCDACSRCSLGLVDPAAAGSMYGNRLLVWGFACACSVGSCMLHADRYGSTVHVAALSACSTLEAQTCRCDTLSYAGFCSITCLLLVVIESSVHPVAQNMLDLWTRASAGCRSAGDWQYVG